MKAILSKAFLLVLFLISAQFAFTQKALEFNNKLVSITDTLFLQGQTWGKKFSEVHATRDYSQLTSYRESMEAYADKKIQELKKMADVGDSKELREAMIDFLEFEKKMSIETLRPFEKLNSTSSSTEIKAAIDKLKAAAIDENAKRQKYIKLQEAYAAKNGFAIADE